MLALVLSMGVDMKVIQELLGHSSIKITADIYAHVLPPMHKDAMDKMDGFLTAVLSNCLPESNPHHAEDRTK